MKTKSGKPKKLFFIFLPFVVLLLALGIVADCLFPQYQQVLNGALGQEARASEEYIQAALENSKNVNIRLEEEGAVLLKNDNNVLPLNAENASAVNVYGILSAHHYAGGTGSGSNNAIPADFKTALESVGFTVNADLWTLLANSKLEYETDAEVGKKIAGQYELAISEYEAAVSFASAKSYSDTAIVTFGTNGGEGADGDRGSTNSLELGGNEIALLERLDSEGFNVVALINSSYVMELGPVMEHADAVLWIGGTGLYGAYGMANILAGDANPSGRLGDTWMYEQETSSTYYTTINDDSVYVDEKGTQLGAYTNYNEGIYVGYKWYETADAEGYWDSVDNAYGLGYDGVVAYPFGYGLSYTTFDEEITDASYEDGAFTFTVKATNTGDVSGKDVLELYAEKPYTDGGVEVAKVELVGFVKTDVLAGGEEEELTITVDEESLASYDSSADGGNGCYVLAGGEYKFYLASGETGAHIWKTASGDARVRTFDVTGATYAGDNKRASDAVAAANLLERTDNDTKVAINDGTAGFRQLSRAGGFANASSTISAAANTNGNVLLSSDSTLYKALTANYGSNTYSNYNTAHLTEVAEFTDPSVDQPKVYSLADLYTTDADGNPLYEIDEETGVKTVLGAVDYDDPRWDVLISQMSVAEMEELIGRGGYGTIAVASIDKIPGYDYDGPTGYSNFLKANMGITQETTGFCAEPIMAATRNVDLVEEYGKAVGKEGNAFGNTGWYAPGMNMHRTPFEGRTGEYFSEDSFVTGMMAASVAYGAFEMGVYTYAKHFAFNEIETHRDDGMNCWMSEQTAREIYLRPFEIAIKQGKLTGMMSSFMLCNAQWNGGNFNLMTGIVRKEWNFKGVINTDLAGKSIMGAERALCAGTDMLLATSFGQNASLVWLRCDTIKTTSAGICAMKTATKHILFSYASAALNREIEAQEADTSGVMALFVTLNVVAYLGAAILLGLFVWRLMIYRKRSAVTTMIVDPEDAEEDSSAEKK